MVVKEDGTHARQTLALAEFVLAPQGVNLPVPHIHHAHEESFYVLEGELEFLVERLRIKNEGHPWLRSLAL